MKVKSHIGIRGNENADQLATQATEQWDMDVSNEYAEPLDDAVWMRQTSTDSAGNETIGPYLTNMSSETRPI